MTARPLVWCNAALPAAAMDRLVAGLDAYRLVQGSEATSTGLADATVAFGQPPAAALAPALATGTLRFVQLTSAGYTAYDTPGLAAAFRAAGAQLCKSSVVYDAPCADHAMAFLLLCARDLQSCQRQQDGDRAWTTGPIRQRSFLLRGQTVLLVGFGSIARQLAARLVPFGAQVRAVRRRIAGDEGLPTIEIADPHLPDWLRAADHVVNLLPANESTRHFFDASRFAAMKPGAFFHNIGRGTTVDQDALLSALRKGHLRGACLDVTDPEPLPPAHPLWTTPGVFITPHTGGGFAAEHEHLVTHFLDNLRRIEAGNAALDRVY